MKINSMSNGKRFGYTEVLVSEHGSFHFSWYRKLRAKASNRLKLTGGPESLHGSYEITEMVTGRTARK